jgi:curved DNA-binding protein CbpA
MQEEITYYDILGVDKNASLDEIKSAYRNLAMRYHPDRNPGNKESEELFKEINAAYDILSDSQKRQEYDAFLEQGYQEWGPEGPEYENDEEAGGNSGNVSRYGCWMSAIGLLAFAIMLASGVLWPILGVLFVIFVIYGIFRSFGQNIGCAIFVAILFIFIMVKAC